jgi:DNA-binding protein H-NS
VVAAPGSVSIVAAKNPNGKLQLEERLKLLRTPEPGRRPYPSVPPKYRNPNQPSETWAGRGKQPRWLVAQLRSGKRIDDFKIKKSAGGR